MKRFFFLFFLFISVASGQTYPFRASIYPSTTNTYKIGLFSNYWDSLFVRYPKFVNIYASGSLVLGTSLDTAYSNSVSRIVASYPLTLSTSGKSNFLGLGYNTTNLKLSSNQINTIQDIATSSSPAFAGLTLSGKSAFSYTDTRYDTSRPVIASQYYTVTPASAVTQYTDYHGIDLRMELTNIPATSQTVRLYPFESKAVFSGTQTLHQEVAAYFTNMNSSSGTITEAIGARFLTQNTSTGKIVNLKSISIETPLNGGGGEIDTDYGIKIEDRNVAGQNFAIYTGAGRNRFGDTLEVNAAIPAQAIFHGGYSGGTNVNHGGIIIGYNPSFRGVLEYDASGGDLYIKNTYNNSGGNIYLQTETSGSPINALTLTGAGNATVAGTFGSGAITASGSGSRLLTLARSGSVRQIGVELSATTWGLYDDTNTKYALSFDASDNATMAANVTIPEASVAGSASYSSRVTGWRAGNNGYADFRRLYTDELIAKFFIADLEIAKAGSEIICNSVSSIDSVDFTVPIATGSATLVVKELSSFTGQIFTNGDTVQLRSFTRTAGNALTIASAWGSVTYLYRNASNNPPTQAYTFTRLAAADSGSFAQASNPIKKGTLVLDYGQGAGSYYEINNSDGQYSPYARTVQFNGVKQVIEGTATLQTQVGKLTGITDADFGGALTGAGFYGGQGYFKGNILVKSSVAQALGNASIQIGNITGTANSAIKLTNTGTASTSGLFAYNSSGAEVLALKLDGTHTLSGFTATPTDFYAGSGATRVQLASDSGIWVGATDRASAPFSVTPAGVLTAKSGTVGGFSIGATDLYAGTGATRIQMDADSGIWMGATPRNSAPFYVKPDGSGQLAGGNINWTAGGSLYMNNFSAWAGVIGRFNLDTNGLNTIGMNIYNANIPLDIQAEILLGSNPSSYFTAAIGLRGDGSGKVAKGSFSWDTSGNVTGSGTWTVGATLNVGNNVVISNATLSAAAGKIKISGADDKIYAGSAMILDGASAGTVTGGTIQTAASGERIAISGSNINFYNADGDLNTALNASGTNASLITGLNSSSGSYSTLKLTGKYLYWGDYVTDTYDVNLYRSAANTLKTDDAFQSPNLTYSAFSNWHVAGTSAGNTPAAAEEWVETSTSYVAKINAQYVHHTGNHYMKLTVKIKAVVTGDAYVQLNVNGTTAEDHTTSTTYVTKTVAVDVSGLTDGTIYPITVSLKDLNASATMTTPVLNIVSY